MHGIFTNIYPINDPNVGKYTIHGSYGIAMSLCHELPYRVAINQPQLLVKPWSKNLTAEIFAPSHPVTAEKASFFRAFSGMQSQL